MSVQLQSTKIEVLPPDTVVELPAKQPHRWQKGESGNPNGRPKESYRISDLAKLYTPQALATLVEVMQDKDAPHGSRVNAAECLLNRAWGKPTMQLQIESKNVTDNIQAWEARVERLKLGIFESQEERETYERVTATMEEARQIEASSRNEGDFQGNTNCG